MFKGKKMTLASIGMFLLFLSACSNSAEESSEVVEPSNEQTEVENTASEETEKPTTDQAEENESEAEEPQAPDEGMPPTALEAAKTIMRLLSNGDMENLSAWVHREKGVRFSPYAYVDQEKDIVFSQEQVKKIMEDPTKYIWRTYPGNGDLIDLTYEEYHKKFVYDADFLNKGEVSLNEVQGEGTSLNNLTEVYPKETHDFVEYYISGIDPANEGMDWRSLRLVFEKMGDDRILVAIIHDQWTP